MEANMNGFTPLPADAPWYMKWLVDNWREIYREFSTWFIVAAAGLSALTEILPSVAPDIQALFGTAILHWLTTACALAALGSKFIKQKELQ
jgi:hypothetical protein